MILMKAKKKVIVVWILFTSLLLTMSSYAWFSTNKILGFQSFNIHIASKGGIEVSTDAVNWKSVLTLADLINAKDNYPNSVNQIPSSMKPVSTVGEIENGKLKMFQGEVTPGNSINEYLLVSKRSIEEEGFGEESAGDFVAFDLFFKNSYLMNLFVTPESSIAPNGDAGSGIENAFRIAFVDLGNLAVSTVPRNVQNLNNPNGVYIWEPNYDKHSSASVTNALNSFGITTSENNASRILYDGLRSEINESANILIGNNNSLKHPDLFKRVDVTTATRKEFDGIEKILELRPGVSKIRVYIWIEGQDIDCEDNASIGDILIDLQLTSEPS